MSGYSLEHLLPERRFNVAQFFAGTEGTLGIIVRAMRSYKLPEWIRVSIGTMEQNQRFIDELRKLDQHELDAICAKHDRLWTSKPGGARAVFSWKDLTGLDLRGKNLCDADLTGAILANCQMQGIRLDHANLFGADLQGAAGEQAVGSTI